MLFNLGFNIWFSNTYFKTQQICFNQIGVTLFIEGLFKVHDEYKGTNPFTRMIKFSYLRIKANFRQGTNILI